MIDPLSILIGYAAVWFLLFYFFYKKKQTIGIAGFTLLFMGVSALTTIYFYQNSQKQIANIQITPFLFILSCVLICLWPFIINAHGMKKIGLAQYEDNNNIIYYFLLLSSPLLIWAIIELSYAAIHTEISALVEIYDDRQKMKTKLSGVGYICVGYMRQFDLIWPILFFYCVSKAGRYKKFAYVALLGTLCMCLDGYIGASRAAIVRQIIYFICVYFMCKNTLSKTLNRRITVFSGGLLAVVGMFLIAITISRFSSGNSSVDILTWISLYSGEGVLRFSEYIWDLDQVSYGDTNFSFVKSCLGLDTFTINDMRREYYALKFNIPTHIFYTYIGDMTMDLGKPLTLVFFIAISSMINSTIRKSLNRGYYTYTSLYWLSVYSLMIIFGIMYFFCKTYYTEMRVFIDFILIWIMQRFLYRPVVR